MRQAGRRADQAAVPVQLGYAWPEADDDSDPYMDKIGGRPRLPLVPLSASASASAVVLAAGLDRPSQQEPTLPLSQVSASLRCADGHPLVLVAQMWAKSAVHKDRFVYLFGCNSFKCSPKASSWKAFRCIKTTISTAPATDAPGSAVHPIPHAPVKPEPAVQQPFGAFGGGQEFLDDEWDADPDSPSLPAFGSGAAGDADDLWGEDDGAKKATSAVTDMMGLLELRNKGYQQPKTPAAPKMANSSNSSGKNAPVSSTEEQSIGDSAAAAAAASEALASVEQFGQDLLAFGAYPLEFEQEPADQETYAHEMLLLQDYMSSNQGGDSAFMEQLRRQAQAGPQSTKVKGKKESADADAASGSGAASGKGDDESGEAWAGEAYETMEFDHYDKLFKKFHKTVSRAPEQCVRYAFGGSPLWYKRQETAGQVASCAHCGGRRVFEYQMMPNVLNVLPVDSAARPDADADTESADAGPSGTAAPAAPAATMADRLAGLAGGMDWGSVLVFACENDCLPPVSAPPSHAPLTVLGLVQEPVLVQADSQ